MDDLYINFISRVAIQARNLRNVEPTTQEIDVLYNGAPDYSAKITQVMIDGVPRYKAAGLTKAQLDSVIYALKMVNVQLDTLDFPALIQLANL